MARRASRDEGKRPRDQGGALRWDPQIERLRWSYRLSLTSRILFVNVLPLVLLGGGVIYLDVYRKQLLDERFKLALVEAQITAEALAGATNERQQALLIQIGKEQRLRIRLYSPEGAPKVWGEAGEGARYEVRALPDGSPGLFDAQGALLVELLPKLILDVAAAGKGRVPPQQPAFELVKLEGHEGGGFSLYGRAEDINGVYDLRVENGKGDPRVHVGIDAKWKRDVDVHRLVPVFRTGAIARADALGHDYVWHAVEAEWVDAAHTPDRVRFGDGALGVLGRQGTEGISARRGAGDRWDVELEMYHYENHPLDVGADCEDTELGGVGRFGKSSPLSMRADFLLGSATAPLVARYPDAKKGAVTLTGAGAGDAARVLVSTADSGTLAVQQAPTAWTGASLAAVPCENGRFSHLAAAGFEAASVAAVERVGRGGNALTADEVDGRGVFAFRHPAGDPLVFFRAATAAPNTAKDWFTPRALAELGKVHGLVALQTDLEAVLSETHSAGTVRDMLQAQSSVWVAPVDDVAQRLVALEDVELDLLPDGVVRVRNTGTTELPGLTLRLPPGVTARYDSDSVFTSTTGATSFDLPPRREQLVQLFRGDAPFAMIAPAPVSHSVSLGAEAMAPELPTSRW